MSIVCLKKKIQIVYVKLFCTENIIKKPKEIEILLKGKIIKFLKIKSHANIILYKLNKILIRLRACFTKVKFILCT